MSVLTCALPAANAAEPCCGPVSPAGSRLIGFLDATGVDHLWLSGTQVDWRTGVPTAGWIDGASQHTHCSAFVASAAMRLGVYVLRPPDHRQKLLANAQMRWLGGDDAATKGWRRLPDVQTAQARANAGDLVLAAVENPDPGKPGHIAIVRPSDIETEALLARGPFVTQAGFTNTLNISLARGFGNHPGAWVPGGGGSVGFFGHTIDWTTVPVR
ncbi:MAG TPA: hypothetical protein VKS60_04775 [Stellaceae bacterium]|nr:hypothetical protein [Stellaceae bacterium]